MRISKTISVLFFASLFFIVSTVIASDKFLSVEKGTSGEDALYVGMLTPNKGLDGMPRGLSDKNFVVIDDIESESTRGPASVKPAAMAAGIPAPDISLATISRRGREVTSWIRSRRRALE